MATTAITSIDVSIAKLAPTFQTAIKATIETESTPLKNTQALKDKIDVRKGIYSDMKTNFDGLQSALQSLISSHGTVGTTVLSATNTDGAATADYDISVSQLAKAQTKASTAIYSTDVALGLSAGTYWLGGNGTKSASLITNTTVTDYATGSVSSGQRELGTGSYTLETRDYDGVRQFRLVNADGDAVSIRNGSDSSFTSSWQTLTTGSFDTGRGLSLTLSASGSTASTAVSYTAAGASISISNTDSLRTIVTAMNAASQPEGRDFKASIVANRLVLTGAQSGANHSILYPTISGLEREADSDAKAAKSAIFTVNGIAVTRASNTGLTNVVDGATLTLASDAEGKTAKLSITASSDKATGLMNSLVTKFNAAMTYLKDKLASTSSTTAAGKINYTRGPLTGDTGISSLRYDLLSRMNSNISNSGSFKNLSEIGLSLDKDNKLVFDSAKFTDALKNHATDLKALLDTGLGAINTVVSRYAGSSGTFSKTLTSIDEQRASFDKRIAKYNESLTARKQTLYDTYFSYQNQLVELNYQSQMFNAMYYGTTATSTTSTTA
ncbi:MAG: flagellar filament capping protein FliD [Chloroflexi bacterium]|nr:flagellar filament capping protein FliD [Chloroflexota bacterium]